MIDLSNRIKFDDLLVLHPYFDNAQIGQTRAKIRGNIENNVNAPRNGVNLLPSLDFVLPEYGAYRVEVRWKKKNMSYFGEGEIIPRICSHVLRILYRPDNDLFKKSLTQKYGPLSDKEIRQIISKKYFKTHWEFCTFIIDSFEGKKDHKYLLGREVCELHKTFQAQKEFCSSNFKFSFFSCDSQDRTIRKRACELAESLLLDKYIKSKSYCPDYCLNITPEWEFYRIENRVRNYLTAYNLSNERGSQFNILYNVARAWQQENEVE